MEGLVHPFSKATYEKDESGHVRVTNPDGRVGVFRQDGSWVSGEKVDVDPQMCMWIGAPRRKHLRLR